MLLVGSVRFAEGYDIVPVFEDFDCTWNTMKTALSMGGGRGNEERGKEGLKYSPFHVTLKDFCVNKVNTPYNIQMLNPSGYSTIDFLLFVSTVSLKYGKRTQFRRSGY